MKYFLGLLLGISYTLQAQITPIHVDQFGYPKFGAKVAVLVDPQVGFNAADSYTPSATIVVRNSVTDQVVFSGSPAAWNAGATDVTSGDRGWWFDFSSLTTNGSYYLQDVANNVSSPVFEISETPYNQVLKAATKMFYYNRSGFVKTAAVAGVNWTDGMSFHHPLQDANCRLISDPSNASLEKDLSGGWFDGDDYNKLVTYSYPTVHNLLTAYQKNPLLFADNWNWPESGNGIPDLLDEVKWELDWLMKMTNADGSVHIKMGSQNYSENTQSPASANMDQRFYGPTCSSASIAAASVLAHAAVVFEQFPSLQAYAAQLLARAETCYNYGVSFYLNSNFETNCDDGSIVSGDTDWTIEEQMQGLLSASIYLYKATNSAVYQTFVINNGYLVSPLENNYWSAYNMPICDAFMYFTTITGANVGMKGSIINSASTAVFNNWSDYFGMADAGLYRDFMPEWSYHGGSNYPKAAFATLNISIAQLGVGDSVSLYTKGTSMLHAFHGVNPLGLVYLSNMNDLGAENSVNEIFHNWFADGTDYDHALNSPKGPPPGIVPGGPNQYYSVSTMTPPFGQPRSKSYLDFNDYWPNNSWEVSAPSIAYQAAYVRLLSEVIGSEHVYLKVEELDQLELVLYPNPTQQTFQFQANFPVTKIEVFTPLGEKVVEINQPSKNEMIDLSGVKKGLYLVKIMSNEKSVVRRIEKR